MKKRDVAAPPKFGTFFGVFLPTFLSIIGVILFLRLGYIVGSAGIVGTLTIILLAISTTLATGLSLSSIITNIRIGSGGVYSIISKSLGLEVGGSVGIPLYLAQVSSIALYVFGFVEGWEFIFPNHPTLYVMATVFVSLFVLTFISTRLAVRAQFVVFVIIVAALLAAVGSGDWVQRVSSGVVLDAVPDVGFWALFALFFPAVTGLMAGIGLSGELRDPKKNIPQGITLGLVITSIIYIAFTFWFGLSARPEDLVSNSHIMVTLSRVPWIVLVGILASTFSSALTTFVAAPRLLQSMGDNSILPGSSLLSRKTKTGVPQFAILFSSLLIAFILLIGNLNQVAPVLTIFFLITYAMINIVVFIEQTLGLVSFRPTLKIPKAVPLYGAISSVIFIFVISPVAGIASIMFLFLSYLYLVKKRLKPKSGDVRSGLFITFSEWAAKKVLTLPESTKHTWKPNILLPVVNTSTLLGNFPLIKAITFPNGTMAVLGMDVEKRSSGPEDVSGSRSKAMAGLAELPELVKKFGAEGIFTSSSTVTVEQYTQGVCVSLEAIEGQVFHPNILFLPFKPKRLPAKNLEKIFRTAKKHNVGIILADRDEDVGLGSEHDIHLWIPPKALEDDVYAEKDFDLAMLICYRLSRNWAGSITVRMSVPKRKVEDARRYIKKLLYEARFPFKTLVEITTHSFHEGLSKAPQGDIHIIPVISPSEIEQVRKISKAENKSFLFIADSTKEDILA